MAAAGVFHAYIKNRQINVARELQTVENRISQHKLDITNIEVRLDDQLNPILINDRLKEISSDLRRIPMNVVQEVPRARIKAALARHSTLSASENSVAERAVPPSSPRASTVAGGP